MRYTVFDIETDGLRGEVSKIHCLAYQVLNESFEVVEEGTLRRPTKEEIINFFSKQECVVGHNIIRYDIPVLQDYSNVPINFRQIDTLPLSWYLFPNRLKHGLEQWGEDLGVAKPEVKDWKNLSIEEYEHRCQEDVKINVLLFKEQQYYFSTLYTGNFAQIDKCIDYLCYKMMCAREQEEVKLKLDVPHINKCLEELEILKNEKVVALQEAMPLNIIYKEVKKPNKPFKANGELSVAGEKWYQLLDELGYSSEHPGPLRVIKERLPGNPASSIQIKDWLDTLGWIPQTFEHRKNTTGQVKAVPQIYDGDSVCQSIKNLYDIEPALENLDMLSLINHRISIFKGFLSSVDKHGFAQATINGFTNTLRFKHRKPIVNLPKPGKFYGDEIRGSIIVPDNQTMMCGSDMSALEDTTKQHYMYFYDPEYVTQMRVPGFDPHLDIAVLSGMLTAEQAEEHKQGIANYSKERSKAKTVNFAGIYGAGAPKIAQSTGMSLGEAQKLHTTYWERNKSVKLVAKNAVTKTVKVKNEEQMWLLNPISGFWYSLRFEKDRFSTLNQGSGVFCFDMWVRELRNRGVKISMQYHDEVMFYFPTHKEDEIRNILNEAIEVVNQRLQLNVPLGVSIDVGLNYKQVH